MCCVEYSEARNREEHPAPTELPTREERPRQEEGIAARWTASWHLARAEPGARFLLFAACQSPSTPPPLSKALAEISLFQFCRGAINHISLSADSSAH